MIDFALGVLAGVGGLLAWQHFKANPVTAPAAAKIEDQVDAFAQMLAASEQRILGEVAKLTQPTPKAK